MPTSSEKSVNAVTRSIHATFSPNALAPPASSGLEDTNSTSAGATPRFASISLQAPGAGLKTLLESTLIERLQAVYAIEAEIRGSTAEQRLAARRTRTAPLMETLRKRLTAMVGQLFSQSKLTEAINYALNHWDGLTLFLSDGRVELNSNTVERSMRPIAVGRRNSLFSGSEGGAESWAILASLVNSAKLHNLDPQTYLADVLERIVSGRTKSHQLHELLAWNWKAAHARIAQVAA